MDELTTGAGDRVGDVHGVVFDMDGTLVLGDRNNKSLRPLPGALEVVADLDARGVPFVVFTNGTTRPPSSYAATLRDIGFAISDDRMLTPVSSAIEHFTAQGHRSIMVLGGDGMSGPLREAGFEVVPRVHGSGADAVLAGWFRELGFTDIEAACDAVFGGARFYSASASRFFATAEGNILGTSRVIGAAVRDITGCEVEVVGKPSPHAVEVASARLGVDPAHLAIVGDDPELEMAMAHATGALAIFVASGVHGDPAGLPPAQQPDLVLTGIDELVGRVAP